MSAPDTQNAGEPAGRAHASAVSGAALTEIRPLVRLLGGMVRGVVPAEDRSPLPVRIRQLLPRRTEGDASPTARGGRIQIH